jgi:hypothetical protein
MTAEIIRLLGRQRVKKLTPTPKYADMTCHTVLLGGTGCQPAFSISKLLKAFLCDLTYLLQIRRELSSGCESSKEAFLGYERFGDLVFFVQPNAGGILDQHVSWPFDRYNPFKS